VIELTKKLSELQLEDIFQGEELDKYKNIYANDSQTVADYIFNILTEPDLGRRLDTFYHENEQKVNEYLRLIEEKVQSGKPIEIFFNGYDPKPYNKKITNGDVLPDMAEFLSFIHLSMIAKKVREIYSPGFRFIIAYEGNLWAEDDSYFSLETSQKTFHHLKKLVKEAERIVGVRNVIKLIDVLELIEPYKKEFLSTFHGKFIEIMEKYDKKDTKFNKPLDVYRDYVLDELVTFSDFTSEEDVRKYALELAFKARAFKKIKYKGGPKGVGILHKFPNSIGASVKLRTKNVMSIQLLPGFIDYPYNRLTAKMKDGSWNLVKWEDMQNSSSSFEPVYIKDFDYPFYYMEK
jgi:pyoverdine/dityrosine biosynthesis protein Dit1